MPFLSRTILAAGLLAFGVLPSLAAAVEPDSGNALGLLDAYLSQAADETPPFRTDLEPRAGSAPVPSGRRSGLGSVLGPFTYRPKTYAELTPAERSDLLGDPKFRAFLERTVRPEEPSAAGADKATGPAAAFRAPIPASLHFTVAPDEMLQARAFIFALPTP